MMARRNTVQRSMVEGAVHALGNHPRAEDVYAHVAECCPGISRATVYRNLNLLAGQGAIKKISVPGAADRFDHRTHPHYHVCCTCCGRFEDIGLEYIEGIDEMAASVTEYQLESHDIVFSGVCKDCQD